MEQLQQSYPTAQQLLNEAVRESTVWVVPLVTTGVTPSLSQLETLAVKLLAIVDASTEKTL